MERLVAGYAPTASAGKHHDSSDNAWHGSFRDTLSVKTVQVFHKSTTDAVTIQET